ncbi:MAG: serine/threonine protein kinase [Paracoccaceae bacterium]|nr:serine/threonine protein kinase [Paracoccaceae bacterium]
MTSRIEFVPVTLLKRDAFSETQLGHYSGDPDTRLIRRRLDTLPLWSRWIGRYLAAREARALELLEDVRGVPRLIHSDRAGLVRSWIEGSPLHQVGEIDRRWADDAHLLLREIHRRGVTHNDLAKPQNWLVTPDGYAALIDMQLATVHRRRGLLFRIGKYEDLRHLLKQKRRYAPDMLTPTARRLLERRSWVSRLWWATLKPVYNVVTRRLLNWSDSEGHGKSLELRNEAVQECLLGTPGVRDVAVLKYPRPGGTGLYAFVESDDTEIRGVDAAPDLLQIVPKLPRSREGRVRTDILALIAENRIEELESLMKDDPDFAAIVAPIANGRLNLTDRYIG